MREPLLESTKGILGHIINPGDRVFTFTQDGRGTKVCSGIYRGIIRAKNRYATLWEFYVVERVDGKNTKLHYNGMVSDSTTLDELDEVTI